jgi:hypothetical protein
MVVPVYTPVPLLWVDVTLIFGRGHHVLPLIICGGRGRKRFRNPKHNLLVMRE